MLENAGTAFTGGPFSRGAWSGQETADLVREGVVRAAALFEAVGRTSLSPRGRLLVLGGAVLATAVIAAACAVQIAAAKAASIAER